MPQVCCVISQGLSQGLSCSRFVVSHHRVCHTTGLLCYITGSVTESVMPQFFGVTSQGLSQGLSCHRFVVLPHRVCHATGLLCHITGSVTPQVCCVTSQSMLKGKMGVCCWSDNMQKLPSSIHSRRTVHHIYVVVLDKTARQWKMDACLTTSGTEMRTHVRSNSISGTEMWTRTMSDSMSGTEITTHAMPDNTACRHWNKDTPCQTVLQALK